MSHDTQPKHCSIQAKRRLALICASLVFTLFFGGCATGPNIHPRDPMEPLNRGMFSFNEAVDNAVLKPVANAYHDVMPHPIRNGVSNVFSNLEDFWSMANNIFQGRGNDASDSFGRVLLNSTFGLGGLFDVASQAGIERHPQDFGQTLGHWGMGSGPYLVLPILGSSTLRDAAALPIDFKGDLTAQISQVPERNSAQALRIISERESLLGASKVLEAAALDKYSFVRDAHLQRRDASILSAEALESKAKELEKDDEDNMLTQIKAP